MPHEKAQAALMRDLLKRERLHDESRCRTFRKAEEERAKNSFVKMKRLFQKSFKKDIIIKSQGPALSHQGILDDILYT